jgi:LPS sulfotransferase NodH
MEVAALTSESQATGDRGVSGAGSANLALFIVFGHQRTGSTLLASRLDSHPSICCYEEIFLPSVDSTPALRDWLEARRISQCCRVIPNVRSSFLSSLFDANNLRGNAGAAGFKVMYDQMALWPRLAFLMPPASRFFQDPALHRWLRSHRVLVIHILRRNHLKILVSQKLAVQSGRFHSRNPPTAEMKVFMSLAGLKSRLRRIELAERTARRCIDGLPTMEIYYEDYTGGAASEIDARLCSALGQDLPAGGLTSPLRKLSSDDLRDTIANYDAVARHLSGSRFEHFLG